MSKTKLYNDSIVQKCIRTLRDENEKSNIFRIRKTLPKNEANHVQKETKPKVACRNCGKFYEAKYGIKTHQRKCQGSKN